MPKKLSNVSCARGAPMGRSSYGPPPPGTMCHIDAVEMDSDDGAYDSGGAYWGHGNPIFIITHEHEDGGEQFLRASGKCEAMRLAKEKWPGIKFPDAAKHQAELRKEIKELKSDIMMMDGEMSQDIAMNWLFEICGILYRRGITYPTFSPGGSGEPECTYEEWLDPYSTDVLLHVARVLDRYDDILRARE